MRYADLKPGMKLRAIGDYADCIKTGDEFVVYEAHGAMNISCRGSGGSSPGRCHHELKSMAANGSIPELVPE